MESHGDAAKSVVVMHCAAADALAEHSDDTAKMMASIQKEFENVHSAVVNAYVNGSAKNIENG